MMRIVEMINWIKGILGYNEEEVVVDKSESLPQGKLMLIPCSVCGEPWFYYTHKVYPLMVPVYQHIIRVDGTRHDSTDVIKPPCGCTPYQLPSAPQCTLVDNPFLTEK